MVLVLEKNELRKKALEKRAEFRNNNTLSKISSNILSKILNSKDFICAKNIALYYPYKNEIDISPLLKLEDKNFYLPKCIENNLYFAKYDSKEGLKKGKYGIFEPAGEIINPKILDLIYIPALIANTRNFRLGYGMGYYDRFFRKNSINAKKIIVIAKDLITNSFLEDNFDYQCDEIVSA